MIRSTALALLLASLTGCGGPRADPGVSLGRMPEAPSQWRMLTEAKGPDPVPLGYVEIQRVAGGAGMEGLGSGLYVAYDRQFRVLGHVTARGHGLRYRGPDDDIGESLGIAGLHDQLGRILGAKGPPSDMRSFDLQGRPQGIP